MSKQIVINPIEQISDILAANGYGKNLRLGHIIYDKSINDSYDYQIIRSSKHDGTFIFKLNLIQEVLSPIINKQSYYKANISEEELNNLADIEYTIGDINIESEYGVTVKHFTGMRDTVTLPVKVKYSFK